MSKAFVDVAESDIALLGIVWREEPAFAITKILLSDKTGKDFASEKHNHCQPLRRSSAKSSKALRILCGLLDGGSGAELEPMLDTSQLKGFQRKALLTLKDAVPRGRLTSYGRLAGLCGSPGAARAVGAAMGANPFPLLIPCHRVVCSDGSPGGFGPGLPLKLALLEKEGLPLRKGLFELKIIGI